MLIVNNLDHFYGESHTLWDIDFEIEKGACMCLMGRNGVGKTTLLKCIMGLEPIRNGEININGTEFLAYITFHVKISKTSQVTVNRTFVIEVILHSISFNCSSLSISRWILPLVARISFLSMV